MISEKIFVDFVKSIEEELNVSFIYGEGYYYETATNTINIDVEDFEECGFFRHLKEFHHCNFATEFNLILWSILHEIGHYATEDVLEEEDFELRAMLTLTDENSKYNENVQNLYFNLPSEFAATEWAVNWIEENYDKAVNFNRLLDFI